MTSTPPASKSPRLFICIYTAAAFFLFLLSSVPKANAQLECFHFCFPGEAEAELGASAGAGCCVPLPPLSPSEPEPEPLPMPLPLPVEPPRPIAGGPILDPSSTLVGAGSSSSSIATPVPIPPVESLVPGVTIPGGTVHDGANGGQKLGNGNSNAETMPSGTVPGGTVHDGANGGQKIGDKVLHRRYKYN